MLALLIALVTQVLAFNAKQHAIARSSLATRLAPPFTTIIDSAQAPHTYAFTDSSLARIYIDGRALACCPTTFSNVVCHEIEHARGRVHNSIPGDIMSYRVSEHLNGSVIEDPYLWCI